ncbi:MAG: porin family protein [Bacteroidota bacterium]
MKKITMVLAMALIALSFNQANAQLGFQLGVKGGPNFSNIKTEVNTEGQTGLHIGAYGMIKFTKVAIQPEILFSTQSTEFSTSNFTTELKSSYVNIPIMVKLYLAGGLNLQVGPQFGFATLAEARDSATGTTADIADELKGADVSIAFGAGFDLPFGLNLTARYNLGISNFNDSLNLDLDPATDEELKNQVFQVSVGYAFIKK